MAMKSWFGKLKLIKHQDFVFVNNDVTLFLVPSHLGQSNVETFNYQNKPS